MDTIEHEHEETTLDPADWLAFRNLAHRAVDDLVDWWRTLRERPVWQPVPPAVRARLARPLPRGPQAAEDVYADFRRDVLPYPYGNVHPRFWGWVNGSGLPIAVLADFLASAMNPNVGGLDQAATHVEEQVLAWLREMLAFPADTGAILTSGCTMANTLALAAARTAGTPEGVREHGLRAIPEQLVIYGSQETHSSVQKAVELLGIGHRWLRRAARRPDRSIDVEALARAVHEDRRAGHRPFAVTASAGAVNSGAIDDLDALADLCEREDLWLHVDGAFGALTWLCPEERGPLAGLQRADSLAFDLHKWLYLPVDVGCAFVRRPGLLQETFALEPSYLSHISGGMASTSYTFMNRGLELTRRFRALKVWMALKEHGVEGFERTIRQNLAQARYLGARVEREEGLELMAPVTLNVICLRYVPPGRPDEAQLDRLNERLLVRLQESGAAVPSHTVLDGRFCLRLAVTNHRSQRADFDFLVDELLRLGAELAREHHDRSGATCPTDGRTA